MCSKNTLLLSFSFSSGSSRFFFLKSNMASTCLTLVRLSQDSVGASHSWLKSLKNGLFIEYEDPGFAFQLP